MEELDKLIENIRLLLDDPKYFAGFTNEPDKKDLEFRFGFEEAISLSIKEVEKFKRGEI
jgi:hypothetical protein